MNKLPVLDVDEVRNLTAESAVEVKISSVTSDEVMRLDQVSQGGINIVKHDYDGEYEFTPTQSTQIVPTADKTLEQNIKINPIPSNYGLITWNGSVLTVS